MSRKRFVVERLDHETIRRLSELARLARGDILKMTTLAGSGHPGEIEKKSVSPVAKPTGAP